MKKSLLVLVFALSFNLSNAQEVLLNDYSQNEIGKYDDSNKYEELYLSTYTEQYKGEVYNGLLIKGKKGYASSKRPFFKIPINLISEFHIFLKNGRDKYNEWENIRKEAKIDNMDKTIDVFAHKLDMEGDDYGYFSGITDVSLEFRAAGGVSNMMLKVYLNKNYKSDLLTISLMNSSEDWRDLALLRLINDLTIEKVQVEIGKLNKGQDLFKN